MLDNDEVERLAAKAAEGDATAMDDLLRYVQPEVLRRCGRFLPCPQDAEEACQDALLRIAERLNDFEWRSKFTTWLYMVVSNSALQTYRSLKRRAEKQVNAGELLEQRPDPRTTSVIAGSRLDFLDALEKLNGDRPHLTTPLVLRDVYQLPYADVADYLAVPLGTAKSHVHDARKIVREALAGYAR